jgi:hypothetical protein
MSLNRSKPTKPVKTGEPTILENRRFEIFPVPQSQNDAVLCLKKKTRNRKEQSRGMAVSG